MAARAVAAALAVGAAAGGGIGAAAAAAGAQVPIVDRQMTQPTGRTMLGRFAEWYATAVSWRDAMIDRSRDMLEQTREVVRIRERWEQRAIGELGRIGELVPDWRGFANNCAVNGGGATVCALSSFLPQRYEQVLASTIYDYVSPVFQTIATVDSTVNAVIGQQMQPGFDLVSAFDSTAQRHMAQADRFLRVVGRRGPDLTNIGRQLNTIIDSVVATQVAGQPLSSGRAIQLKAALSEAEAEVELELARASLDALELNAVTAADQVSRYRASKRTTHGATVSW